MIWQRRGAERIGSTLWGEQIWRWRHQSRLQAPGGTISAEEAQDMAQATSSILAALRPLRGQLYDMLVVDDPESVLWSRFLCAYWP